MIIKWEDLVPGDKVRISPESLKHRGSAVWHLVMKGVLTIKKIDVKYYSNGEKYISITFEEIRNFVRINEMGESYNYTGFNVPLLEIVELSHDD